MRARNSRNTSTVINFHCSQFVALIECCLHMPFKFDWPKWIWLKFSARKDIRIKQYKMMDGSNEVKSDDDMAAVGIWVLVSVVVLIGCIALLYYIRYVRRLSVLNAGCSVLISHTLFISHSESFNQTQLPKRVHWCDGRNFLFPFNIHFRDRKKSCDKHYKRCGLCWRTMPFRSNTKRH